MTTSPRLDRRRFLLGAGAVLLAACSGTDVTPAVTEAAPTTPPADPTSTGTPAPSASPSTVAEPFDITSMPDVDYPTGIVPTRIEIPSIGVDAPVVELNLTATEAEVPVGWDDAGWWVQTRKPGEIGPAMMGGHVDSKAGPAVFYRLDELRPGDAVTVYDQAGESRSFIVNADPIQVDKYARPDEVFAFGEGRPELRLVTCGGNFNPAVGHYEDNIVVFCHDPSYEA